MGNKGETKFQRKTLYPRTKKRRKQKVFKNIPPQDGLRTEDENGVVDVYVETIDEAGENEEDTVNAAETLSASARKLRSCCSSETGTSRTNNEDTSSTSTTSFLNDNINGYVLFDIMIFINMKMVPLLLLNILLMTKWVYVISSQLNATIMNVLGLKK